MEVMGVKPERDRTERRPGKGQPSLVGWDQRVKASAAVKVLRQRAHLISEPMLLLLSSDFAFANAVSKAWDVRSHSIFLFWSVEALELTSSWDCDLAVIEEGLAARLAATPSRAVREKLASVPILLIEENGHLPTIPWLHIARRVPKTDGVEAVLTAVRDVLERVIARSLDRLHDQVGSVLVPKDSLDRL